MTVMFIKLVGLWPYFIAVSCNVLHVALEIRSGIPTFHSVANIKSGIPIKMSMYQHEKKFVAEMYLM